MLYTESHAGFPWYSEIDRQNRYKEHCANVCTFRLLTPINTILPFNLNTRTSIIGPGDILSWKVFCENGALQQDLSAYITPYLEVELANSVSYITYAEFDIPNLVLPCGSYYMVIETTFDSFYSEVFYVEDFSEADYATDNILHLFTGWPYHNKLEKTNRFKNHCSATCDYFLITARNALLPFQFKKPTPGGDVHSWLLKSKDGTCEHNIDVAHIEKYTFEGYDYYTYYGEDISDLPCGLFDSEVYVGGDFYYGELIKIVDDLGSVDDDSNLLLQENAFPILQETGEKILWQ